MTEFRQTVRILAQDSGFVVSYAVASRTKEIGVRMSLGADRRGVLEMAMRQGLAPLRALRYRPYWAEIRHEMSLMVRTPLHPAVAAAAIREAVWKVDPELPIPPFRTLESLVLESVSERRFQTLLVLVFGGAALLLAGLGVYGVVSHAVSRRTVEFGIRSALGARARDLRNLAVWHGAAPTLVGLGAGWVAALGAGRLMRGLLFGVSEFDAASYFVALMVLLGVALLTAYLPARRAARIEPMIALRNE